MLGSRAPRLQPHVQLEQLLREGDEHLRVCVLKTELLRLESREFFGELAGGRTGSEQPVDATDVCVVLVLGLRDVPNADRIPVAEQDLGDRTLDLPSSLFL